MVTEIRRTRSDRNRNNAALVCNFKIQAVCMRSSQTPDDQFLQDSLKPPYVPT